MHKILIAGSALLASGACQTSQTTGVVAGASAGAAVGGPVGAVVGASIGAAATAPRPGPFLGSYSGRTARGGDVRILVPASGTPAYVFRGEPVRVTAARQVGDTLVLDVGTRGEGRIVLTPMGDGRFRYDYRFRDQTASAVLVRV